MSSGAREARCLVGSVQAVVLCGDEDVLFAQCPVRVAALAAKVVRPFVELQLHLSTTSCMLAS